MYDARKENYERVTVLDQPALFTCGRLDRKTIPEGLYAYDVRHDDYGDGCPCEIAPFVRVNHWGCILTEKPIEMSDDGCRYLEVEEVEYDEEEKEELEEDTFLDCLDWNYDGGNYTISEYIAERIEEVRTALSGERSEESCDDEDADTPSTEELQATLQLLEKILGNI